MSTENVISIEIPPAELQVVKDAIITAMTTLAPYMLALSPEQRRTIPKMSDGSEPFVSKVMDYTVSDPQFVPPFVDVPEMKKDFDAVTQLLPLLRMVDQLQSNLNDTVMMAGSEAFVAALSYYNSVKLGTRMNIPNAKPIFEDLRKRFERRPVTVPSGPEL